MSEVLYWHDLSSDEVLDIAYMELQAREAAANKLGRIAFSSNPLMETDLWNRSRNILIEHEFAAQNWFEEYATTRDLFPAPAEIPMVIDNPAMWIKELLKALPNINMTQLAGEAELSPGYLSQLRSGKNKKPSENTVHKLIGAYARIKQGKSSFLRFH